MGLHTKADGTTEVLCGGCYTTLGNSNPTENTIDFTGEIWEDVEPSEHFSAKKVDPPAGADAAFRVVVECPECGSETTVPVSVG